MKNIGVSLSENFQFLEVKFAMYLNRRVFVIANSSLSLLHPRVSEVDSSILILEFVK